MLPRTFTAATAAAVLVAACVSAPVAMRRDSPTNLRCDAAVAQGVAFGHGEARAIATAGARQQVAEVRGYLLSSGLSHVRASGSEMTCQPYALGGGLTQCVAVLRFCGR